MNTETSDRVNLNSSTLATAAYDHTLARLELDFCDGARYSYSGVAAEIFRGLLCADSKGRYFNRHIRGHFPHVKMPVEN
jgi:KTSC domain-containing protein